ncbi:hypothetical protein GLOTRDRAFT_50491, partial [Gloeophyllum trabeum ATCC 11539]
KAIGGMSFFNVWWTPGETLVLVITLLVKAPVKARTGWLPFHPDGMCINLARTTRLN